MSQFPLPDNLDTDDDEMEFSDPELRKRVEELEKNGELPEPGPCTLERYVHPLTGEVIIEGDPDQDRARATREASDRWWAEQMRKRYGTGDSSSQKSKGDKT